MIKFFRKIRQNLLTENKFSKYMIYAIGEIVLVVIGILIALGISNQNQQKINEKKIASILKEIQSDLVKDIEYSKLIFDYHIYTDSIAKLILNDKFTYEDYKTGNFETIGYNYRDFKTISNGYDNFKRNIDNVPEKYSAIINDLKNLYELEKIELDVYNERIRTTVYKNIDEFTNFNWNLEQEKGIVSEEQINYRLNDDHYKNMVIKYMNDRINVFWKCKSYKSDAINLYNKISELLESKDSIPKNVSYNSIKGSLGLNNSVGTYELKETVNNSWDKIIEIKEVNGQLFLSNEDSDDIEILWYDKSVFVDKNKRSSILVIFNRSKKGELYISGSTNMSATYQKVE
ncbi:hypothetical protein [Psychroserpens ponticola]|uniref:Uncharacterized protein n=1 Tax=Psychroserpens ponticola TaxID=2932268 RepID=A0ABY7RTK3_9FLAO|nr:hypothetical protein [Psychroserpens ponticola]WCO00429.1 hypothetical protein MUN68_010140 [Psychroserpens ponticola]